MTTLVRGSGELVEGERELRARLPDVDAAKFGEILQITLAFSNEGTRAEFLVVHDESDELRLTLEGVRQLQIPEIHEHPVRFAELDIRDVSKDGLEGVRYRLEDIDGSGVLCLCKQIRIQVVERREA